MNFHKIERAMGQFGFGETKPSKAESSSKAKARAKERAISKARQSRKSQRISSTGGGAATQVADFDAFGDTGVLSGPSSETFPDSIAALTREEVRALVKREERRRRQLKQAVNDAAANDKAATKSVLKTAAVAPQPKSPQPVERRVKSELRVAKLERRTNQSLADAATEAFDTVVHSLDMPDTDARIEPKFVEHKLDLPSDPAPVTERLGADSVGTKAVKMRKHRGKTGGRIKLKLEELFAQDYLNADGKPSSTGKKGEETKPLPLLEEFRRIKRPLLANAFGQGLPAAINGERIMITSALPSEGKSFCAIHLALSIASEVDTSVLLVEADVAKPTVLKKLGHGKAKGLANWFADPRLDIQDLTLSTNIPGLKILPAGMEAPDSIDMLASRAMTTFFDRIREAYPHDLIIVDAPPLLPATETKVLATLMGQVVVVVEAGETPKTVLTDALEMLKDIEIVGLLLNKSLRQPKSAGYGYGYGY